jgi:hypothetical protein
MDCNLFRDNILAFSEKTLPSPLMEILVKHVNECEECSLILSEFNHIAEYIKNESAIEPRPFAETRIYEGVSSFLALRNNSIAFRISRKLQPAFIGLVVIVSIVIGILIGHRGERQYSTNQPTDEQIESMRSDLNVPDFMDEDNTTLN